MPTGAQNLAQAAEAQSSPDILLFEFWEEGSSSRDRAALNNEDITHDSNTYTATNFQVEPPSGDEDFGQTSLSISNVSRVAGKAAQAAKGKIRCRMILVDGSDHDTAILDTEDMLCIYDAEVNSLTVTGSIGPRAQMLIGYPFAKTSKTFFPGAYLK